MSSLSNPNAATFTFLSTQSACLFEVSFRSVQSVPRAIGSEIEFGNFALWATIWQHAAHTADQLSWLLIKEPYQNAYLKEKYWRIFWRKKSEAWASRQKKDTTERAVGIGRKPRDQTVKWNHMTALRFHRKGGDIRHPRPPLGILTTGVIVDI